MSETVFILRTSRGRSARTYHTDETCTNLPSNPREITPAVAERMDLEECAVCSGTVEYGGDDPLKYIREIEAQRDA